MPQKPDPPREGKPSSPLIRAIEGVAVKPPAHATVQIMRSGGVSPWRRNLLDSIPTFIPDMRKRGDLGDKISTIERSAGEKEDLVLTRIHAVCQQEVAPLGQDAACSFFDAMYLISIRARRDYPDEPRNSSKNTQNIEKRAKFICDSAEKFGLIAAHVSNERVFCLVCSGMERIKDLRVLSKYMNYMLSASKQIRSESNPEGIMRDAGEVGFNAKFIGERSNGENAAYVDELLTKLIMKLNEPGAGTP